ncbi:MAG: hypothetical protein ABGX16_03050 [Pirellulales bacterium]
MRYQTDQITANRNTLSSNNNWADYRWHVFDDFGEKLLRCLKYPSYLADTGIRRIPANGVEHKCSTPLGANVVKKVGQHAELTYVLLDVAKRQQDTSGGTAGYREIPWMSPLNGQWCFDMRGR